MQLKIDGVIYLHNDGVVETGKCIYGATDNKMDKYINSTTHNKSEV